MWLVVAALRRPITVVVLALGVLLGAALAIARMPRDIFPELGIPVIYVVQTWSGMTPAQMEGVIVSKYEYHFLYIAGIEHIESESIQGVAIMKLYFHPGTDTSFAMAQVTAMAYRATAFMPPGTVPPFIMRLDAGSYPVAQLTFKSETRTDTEIQDLALYRVRPILATMAGVSAPPPFGGKVRMVTVDLDPEKLRARSMSPEEVAVAIAQTNAILPEGAVRIGDEQLLASTNAVVKKPTDLNDVPLRAGAGATVFLRDVGVAEDGGDVVTNIAHVNGRRAVYLPITKRAGASTLAVIDEVRKRLPEMQRAVPDDIEVGLEFDQSIAVKNAIVGLLEEGVLGALLTGLAVLAFIRDWRSALVVVLSIPISVLMAVVALWLAGQTVNVMTLGGLALAVGVLVDEATVEIENVHVHLARKKPPALAVLDAMREVRVPRFVAMLCVCAVFLPSFFMTGVSRALFAPLALAVGFAMVSSYVATSTLVPVVAAWVLRETGHDESRGLFARFRSSYERVVALTLRGRWVVVATYLVLCGAALLLAPGLPTELFPRATSDRFQIRYRAPDGTRLERTEEIALGALEAVKDEVGKENVEITLANLGFTPASAPVSAIFTFNGGPHEGILLVSLRPDRARSLPVLEENLRRRLGSRFPGVRFSFEAGDVVSQVLNTGSPHPVNVVVMGNDLAKTRAHAEKIEAELAKVKELRDLSIPLALDYPALRIDIDRERAGQLGVTANRVARSLVEATWSSQLTQQNYWIDANGLAYFVAVRVKESELGSVESVKNIPVMPDGAQRPLLRDVALVTTAVIPGGYDHWDSKRTVSVVANSGTDDLGLVAREVDAAIARAGEPPAKDMKVFVTGQVRQMRETLQGLELGLGLAVVVVILLLAANFQSVVDALAILLVVPAVLAGVVLALVATRTSANLESFMGAIMAVGVSVANAVLLVKFTQDRRREGVPGLAAAREAAGSRLRPILMTSLAMLAGMLPMALALGESGEQNAPLGRAVMGGLLASTAATLLVLPAVLAILHGDRPWRSASLDPHDPESARFVP
ncbi:MAG TPA: efflux RND transporter permease subunit [Planctomycetota bacterium]|nr:efflux RND transporter permease subunit [Planctomycetota bacterium]